MELDPKFREFEQRIVNEGTPDVAPIPPRVDGGGGGQGGMITDLQRLFIEANKAEDTSEYSYNTRDVSKKYAVTYKGVDNEEVYGQGQKWGSKMVNGVGKGLLLTGTTFLQSTVGLVNGVVAGLADGKFSSFYDNEMNRQLDAINKEAEENWLPNYYTQAERDANWYSPTKLLSANFFWDGIIKNLGFAAGAALSGGVYSAALKSIPITAKLFASGKAAATLAATEEGLLTANKAAGTFGKIKSLSDKFVTGYSSMNVGGRAVVAGLATTGEAGFEAYNNAKEFREQKIKEYKDTHSGLAPTELELQRINQLADEVGNSSFVLNTALLTATNYIQFPKILGSSARVEKGIVSAATKEINEVAKDAAGNLIVAPARYGKVLGFVGKAVPYAFSPSEAFEEGAQFAISSATQDYYNKKLKGDSANFAESLIEGVSETLTTNEGMENVLIGGLSGALMTARGRYKEERQKTADTAKFVADANKFKISDFTKETVDAINRGTVIQEEREKHLRQGDTLMSKESERDYLINYLTPRIKYGRLDLVKSDIADLRLLASTEDGFNQLVQEGKVLDGDTRPAYLQRLTNLETTADGMNSLYQSLTLRYGNMVNNKNQPLYNQEVMSKMMYAATKVADYDVRIPQLSDELTKENIDINSVIDGVVKDDEEAFNKALADIDALKVIDDVKVDLKIALQDVKDLTQRRQKFLQEYDEIKKSPEKFSVPVLTEEEKKLAIEQANQPKKTVKIKTKVGEKDFEIGTEYFLGKRVYKTKEGYEVYRFPKLTILGENEDGTIKIKDSDGLVRDVSKAVLAEYRLHKVSDVATNENANFYLRNMNNIVYWNRGKDKGGEVPGRLVYDDNGKLYFVYKNKKGEIKETEVGLDSFKPKPGFKDGIFRFGETLTKEDLADIEKREASGKTKEDIDSRRANRLKILSDLFDEVSDKLTSTTNLIQQKYAQFEKIVNDLTKLEQQIKAGELTKTNTFKKTTNNAIKAANRLSRMQEDLRLEIEKLEAEKEQLEINQAYIFDLSEGLDELPSDSREFLKELQNEKDAINDLVVESGLVINSLSKLLDNVEGALKTAVDFALDLIRKFEAKYPNLPYTPLGLREFLNKDLEFKGVYPDYQSYLQANPNLLADLTEFERDIAEIDDLDVVPNERSVAELKSEIEKLYEQISEAEKQLRAKSLVLDRFSDIAAAYKKQQEEEKAFAKDNKLREEFIGTNTDDVETLIAEDLQNYEAAAKKGDYGVVGGTMPIDDGKAHQKRANNFGFRLPKIDPNGDEIFGIVVTQKTEDKLGLKGLMNHLYPTDPGTVIALVMVRKDEYGTYSLVDEFGEVIPAGSDMINNAIYQVFPEKKLTAKYNGKVESMFRDATSETRQPIIKALTEQYSAWRDARLAETTLGKPRSVGASFGVPEYVKQLKPDGTEGPIDYAARTSATESGLISEDDLSNGRVLLFSTTNDAVSNGSVTFETPLGRVFLKVPGGLVKLFNRRFNKKEAETIFDVIHQAAKNAVEDKTLKTERTQMLFSWLKSVTYWGIAKNTQTGVRKDKAGYNNIWFEDVADEKGVSTTKLFISGKGGSFAFTPSSLETNKADIISLLQNLYFNANATMANADAYNKKYKEIIGINKDGTPQYKTWDNYQTFLLSSKGRKKDEIPFATVLKPQVDPDSVNRKDIYFKLRDVADDYVLPVATPVVTQTPVPPASATTGGTPSAENLAKITKLKEIKELIATTPDINFKMDDIFAVVDEAAYEAWMPGAVQANVAEIKPLIADATDELDAANISGKYLIPKFIDEQIAKLEKAPAATTATPTTAKTPAPGVYILDGFHKNTYYLKNNKGAIYFTADIKKYNPADGTIPLSFEAADEATAKYLTDTFKTEAIIKQKVGGSIMLALKPQIDAYVTPAAPVAPQPITPIVTPAPTPAPTAPATASVNNTQNIFEEVLEAHYGSFIYQSSKYVEEVGLTTPEIYGNDFNAAIKKIIDAKGLGVIVRGALFSRLQSLLENRLVSGTTGVQGLVTYINDKFNVTIKIDSSAYDALSQELSKLDNEMALKVMGNVSLSNAEKLQKSKELTLLRNKWYQESANIINDILSQVDSSIPKLKPIKATKENTPGISNYDRKETLDNFVANLKAKNKDSDARVMAVLNKYGITFDDFIQNIETYYKRTNPASINVSSGADASAPFIPDGWNDEPVVAPDNKAYRIKLANQINNYVSEDWGKIEQFVKDKLSFIPFYRVKNVIQATNGRQAWGMFHKAAIYVYENAEVGTAYHEVFEAVWKMFTDPKEQKAILDEFKKRKGTFVDRETNESIKYSEATPYQIKEQLAEEFRDFVLTNKNVGKPTYGKSLISRMFAELVNFIRELFYGPKAQTNTANLFAKIGNGYYKNYVPYESSLGFAQNGIIDIDQAEGDESSEFRLDNIPAVQQHEIIQNMTYSTLSTLSKTNKDLFSTGALNKAELYDRLKKETKQLIRWQASMIEKNIKDGLINTANLPKAQADINALRFLYTNVEADWAAIVEKHQEHLKTFSVEFDENDQIEIKDEDKGKDTPYGDSRKIDGFRKANSAIKLILGTLPVMEMTAEGPQIKRTSMGGAMLLPSDKVFITVMSKIHDAVNIDDMLNKLRILAEGNPDYEALYQRIAKRPSSETGIDYSQLNNDYDLQLITSFWRTFKKQNADVRVVFVLPSGDVVIGDSTLSSAAKQARVEMTNSMIKAIKANPIYLKYDEKTRLYQPQDAVTQVKLNPAALNTYTKFLENIGIEFDPARVAKMTDKQQLAFRDAVQGIRTSLIEATNVGSLNSKSLSIDGQLLNLGAIKAVLENPEFESTYFNLNGERAQTFIGTNAVSDLYDVLFKVRGINELKTNPAYAQYKYLTTDSFAKGSNLLNRMFNLKDVKGTRRDETQDLLKTAYVDGTVNEENGKKKESSKLNLKERIIQEINLNLDGYYMHLVPGDASIEWMSKLGNAISEDMLAGDNYEDVYEIFKEYFMSEVELSREDRPIVQDEGKTRSSRDLRFFKNILGDTVHKAIIAKTNDDLTPIDVYKKYKPDIERAVKAFILTETEKTEATLRQYGIIFETEEGTSVENLAFSKEETISQEDLVRNLKALTINYMISNIELHKLVYSDPYQYKDELKRIKNFLSPRTSLIADSKPINEALDKTYNKDFQDKDDIGYTDFVRDYFRSVTLADVVAFSDLPGYVPYKETDGGGLITFKANRNFRLRAGQWNSDEEKQYKFDVEFEKLVKSGASKEEIKKFLKGNPGIMSAYTPLKPIVSGNKRNGRTYNDILLDKFALVPQSFRILYEINPESNALKLYNKMQEEDIDYAVFASGRKVGAEKIHSVYNGDKFNDTPFETPNEKLTPDEPQGVTFVPYSIVSVQAEVPSKEAAYVTQGSQITKLATMDFMEAGVPIDFEPTLDFDDRFIKWMGLSEDEKMKSDLYKEIKRNQELLQAKIEEGFNTLIKDLGIKQTETTVVDPETNEKKVVKSFVIEDKDKLSNTLKDEVLKREVNDNIIEAFNGFKKGDIVLEATPAYQQIKNVLYSIADKRVISPKISGGQKVQIPSSFLESNRIFKTEKGGYQSDFLKFYEKDGERVCEIMVGRWFKSNLSDEALLKYLNTDEGKKILSGIGFRIPTQKQNSIDSFVIKGFLPAEFGDSVVIPSELVQKSGSDFDIDKLSLYFKNIFKDSKGNINLVERKGSREETIAYYSKVFDEILEGSKIKKAELFEAIDIINYGLEDPKKLEEKYGDILNSMLEDYAEYEDLSGALMRELEKLGDANLQAELREKYATQMYKKALENEYIQSLQNLVSHPANFDNLIKPNSAEQLQDLAKDVNEKLGRPETDYSSPGNMLSRTFMTDLRQAFVSGKYAIGIAATAQTLQAQFQRFSGYVDYDKLEGVTEADKKWLGDGKVKFAEFNTVNVPGKGVMPSLSMINNAERSEKYPKGQTITDIIAQFIDGYVDIAKGPWIMQLGATPNVASTWLFLAKIGVPIKTVAYFMNQPIVRDYLRAIESNGYSYMFIDRFFNEQQEMYKPSEEITITELPNETALGKMVGKSWENMTPVEKAQQQFILQEFVKYGKLAEHLFHVTQGSNFDTAVMNDPFLVFKKMMQLVKARKTMISSVDDVLDNSFVGVLKDAIFDVRDAFSTILMSDKKSVRNVLEASLLPFIELNDKDFIKVSQKMVNDLFDWAVQTDRSFNSQVEEILLGKGDVKSASAQVIEFQKKVLADKEHPLFNNMIINSIREQPGGKKGAPNNLLLAGKGNKVYDQNLMIYSFRELKKHLGAEGNDLYKKLVRLAVIQSGLTNSPIAFTSLLPYEDFKEEYNETISKLDNMPNLAEFYNLDVFQRNNWNNNSIVASGKAKWKKSKKGKWYSTPTRPSEITFVDKKLKNAIAKGVIPQLLNFSTMSAEGRSEFITFSWEKGNYTKEQKKQMRKKSDYSYIEKGLFKKVYNSDGTPFIQTSENKDGSIYESFVYKAINAWGDSFRANEFYLDRVPSKLENGFMKVEAKNETITIPGTSSTYQKLSSAEVSDDLIVDIYNGGVIIEQEIAPTVAESEKAISNIDMNRRVIKLKDGITYSFNMVKAPMLNTMGYNAEEINEILKSIC